MSMKLKILLSAKTKMKNYVNAVQSAGGIAVAQYLPKIADDYNGMVLEK